MTQKKSSRADLIKKRPRDVLKIDACAIFKNYFIMVLVVKASTCSRANRGRIVIKC